MVLKLFVVDAAMVIAALGSTASAAGEVPRRPIKRWRLLLPGFLALLAAILMIAFPTLSDLFDSGFWMVLVVSVLIGVVRGAFIGMASDHYWKLVRLDNGIDALAGAACVLLIAIVQFIIEVTSGAENRAETTFEFVMAVIAGYLLGRSTAAWFRARALHHHDLKEV